MFFKYPSRNHDSRQPITLFQFFTTHHHTPSRNRAIFLPSPLSFHRSPVQTFTVQGASLFFFEKDITFRCIYAVIFDLVSMAMSPGEKTDELTTGESQRAIPTPFLTKTYQLVDDPSSDEMISWNEHGNAFIVWRQAEFARDLLPKYFKHNNFSSFIRQLNTYGFRKIVSDRWEFANDYFRRGEKSLLREIHRRKICNSSPITPPAPAITTAIPLALSTSPANSSEEVAGSSNSWPITRMRKTDLLEENERLKEQNSNLRCELDHLRSLCSNVVNLMSNFMVNQSEKGVGVEEGMCPRLFGVSLGVKRVRRSGEDGIEAQLQGDDEMQKLNVK